MQAFDSLWDYNKPAETEAAFRELLSAAAQQDDPEYQAQLLTQIGRTLSLQQKFAEAHEILDQALGQIDDETPIAQIRYSLERGRTFNSFGDKPAAIEQFQQAWDWAREKAAEFYAVDAAHMLAIATEEDVSLAWHHRALDYAEQCTDARARRWRGSLYNNLGWTYHDLGEYEKAHDIFVKALRAREEQGKDESIYIAQWCIGRVMRSLGRLHEALTIQHDLEVLYDELGEPSGYTYEELGECLLALGEPAEAQPYFAKAYEVLSQDIWLQRNEATRLERLERLGDLGQD